MEYLIDFENKLVLGDSRNPRFIVPDGPWLYKIFQPGNEGEFSKEDAVLGELDGCPHVCRKSGSGYAVRRGTEYPCIRMPRYGGTDLGTFLEDAGAEDLAPERAAALAVELAEPLAGLEERGWRHNDIAPDNFLLTDEGVVLIDLGAAIRREDIRKGVAGDLELRGHSGYIAPEKMMRQISDTSDIYSYGALLFNVVAKGGELGVSYPEEFVSLVRRCRSHEQDKRLPSFRDVLAALRPEPAAPAPVHPDGRAEGTPSAQTAPSPHTPPTGPASSPALRGGQEGVGRRRTRASAPGDGGRALLAGSARAALILSLSFLAMESYLTFFRNWGCTPAEMRAAECRSIPNDIALVIHDIKNRTR